MCLALGFAHPDQLLDHLTGEQISEWEAFNRIHPIGEAKFDFYFAQLMMSIHNIAIGFSGNKTAKLFKMEDFVPNWSGIEEEPEGMSVDQMKNFFMDFAEKHNKKVLEKQTPQTINKGKQ